MKTASPFHCAQRVYSNRKLVAWVSGLCIAGTLLGCRETQTIDNNVPPTAVVGVVGEEIEEGVVALEYDGEPVELTLDGTRSEDIDGEIVAYIWFSGTPDEVVVGVPDGGPGGAESGTNGSVNGSVDDGIDAGTDDDIEGDIDGDTSAEPDEGTVVLRRRVPEGESNTWPDDKAKPKVALDEGLWIFTLYVRDDDDAVSEPATLKVSVGSAAVAACVAAVADATSGAVTEACAECSCTQSPQCQTDVGACDSQCWALIGCVADNCPDRDTACIVEMCADFIGAATPATAAGACVTPCEDVCRE